MTKTWQVLAAVALATMGCGSDDAEAGSGGAGGAAGSGASAGSGGAAGSGGGAGAGGSAGAAGTTATVDEVLQYDDGVCDITNGPGGDSGPGGMIAGCFTPSAYPAKLKSADFFIAAGGKVTTTFGVRVFRADGPGGEPKTEIAIPETTAAATQGDSWVTVDLAAAGVTIDSGDFCVAMEWLTPFGININDPQSQLLCGDLDPPFEKKSYILWAMDKQWKSFVDIGAKVDLDIMIRPTVAVPAK